MTTSKHASTHHSKSLPGKPLVDFCFAQGYVTTRDQSVWLDVHRGSIDNWNKGGGVRSNRADKLACSIGVHPMFIWGDLWFDEQYHPLEWVNGKTVKRNQT